MSISPALALSVFLLVSFCGTAGAQVDVTGRARAAFSSGRTAEALEMLHTHLADVPRDVDARLTYGLLLSWSTRYEEARVELRRVLEAAPNYGDARVALMNVEWWSGQTATAGDLAAQILAEDPGNPQARLVRDRVDAQSRPWTITTWYSVDTFNDRDAWHETSAALGRQTLVGSFIVRGTNAARFGYTDQLVEVEAYPSFRAGTYAFVGVGAATKRDLYPEYRLAFDLYQSLGRGIEVSGGYRRLALTAPVSIYVGTITHYVGHWSVTAKTFFVPSAEHDSWSFHGETRRYVGASGRSFLGVTASQGFSREEPRGLGDVVGLHSQTIRGQADLELSPRMRLLFTSAVSRQERAAREPQWQTTVAAGAAWQF
jgi:YaiO family outer membrane protein